MFSNSRYISSGHYPAFRCVITLSSAIALIFLFLFSSTSAEGAGADSSDSEDYIIYTRDKRNGNNILLPVLYYFNSAFDAAQVPEAFQQNRYFHKHAVVWNRIKNPVKSINRDGGFVKFFSNEFASTRALPNYTLHLIGSGYDFRMLAEWFDYHGFPAPHFFAFITNYAGHFGNEAIESSNRGLTSHDHIADLYFFDLVGNLMFLNDRLAGFFHNVLHLRNWMGQPMLDMKKLRVFNASCNYIIRPYIFGKNQRVRFFFFMGMQYLGGFSFRVTDSEEITLSAGVAVKEPFYPDNESSHEQIKKFRACGGIFYDRNGSLLASLIANGTESYRLRLNIYPELLTFERLNMGLFFGLSDFNRISIGITLYTIVGFGFSI